MSAALVLLGYAVLVATLAPRAWGRWAVRAPRLALGVLQALSLAVVLSVTLAGLAVLVPLSGLSGGVAAFLDACAAAVAASYASPAGALASTAAAAVAVVVPLRAAGCIGAQLRRSRRDRRRHAAALQLVARRDEAAGVAVLESDLAAAYCLPGRHGQVVLTRGALDTLDDEQLAAVLAHERAHLRGRHHLPVAATEALDRAFPRVPLFRLARREVPQLVELLADDAAARRSTRRTVAAALLTLTRPETATRSPAAAAPPGALAAAGRGSVARVHRLLVPAQPLGAATTAAVAVVGLLGLVVPAGVLAAPAVLAAGAGYCPVTFG